MPSVHINALPIMVGALCVLAIGYHAGYKSVTENPAFTTGTSRGMLNTVVTLTLMSAVVIELADCAVKWVRGRAPRVAYEAENPVS